MPHLSHPTSPELYYRQRSSRSETPNEGTCPHEQSTVQGRPCLDRDLIDNRPSLIVQGEKDFRSGSVHLSPGRDSNRHHPLIWERKKKISYQAHKHTTPKQNVRIPSFPLRGGKGNILGEPTSPFRERGAGWGKCDCHSPCKLQVPSHSGSDPPETEGDRRRKKNLIFLSKKKRNRRSKGGLLHITTFITIVVILHCSDNSIIRISHLIAAIISSFRLSLQFNSTPPFNTCPVGRGAIPSFPCLNAIHHTPSQSVSSIAICLHCRSISSSQAKMSSSISRAVHLKHRNTQPPTPENRSVIIHLLTTKTINNST